MFLFRHDNYSSHEGEPYCKSHFKQLFQPKTKEDEKGGRKISKCLGLVNYFTKNLCK